MTVTDTKPHIAPETFKGVPVPTSYRYHWDHPSAYDWRRGVEDAQRAVNPEPSEDRNDAHSPGCFDDCDGSDADGHVPAGIYDPSLPY